MSRRASYRRLFSSGGRAVTLKRLVPNGVPVEATGVRARIRDLSADELASGVDVSVRKVMILAEDVPADFAPVRKSDRVQVDGRVMTIETVDDQSHRDGEILLAYDCTMAGS